MKILYIITKLELGGAQKVCLTLAEAFSCDHEVHLMTGVGGILDDVARKLFGDRFVVNPYMGREISPIADIKALKFIRNYMRKHSFDIVHTHSSKAGILGRYAAYKEHVPRVVHTIHGFAFNDFRHVLINDLYKAAERWASRFAHVLVAVTTEDVVVGMKNNIGKKNQYAVVRAAADIDYFAGYSSPSTNIRQELHIPDSAHIVTQISCFKKQKNPIDFVRLASHIVQKRNDVYFILIGDGDLRPKIEEMIKKLNVSKHLQLLGWKDDVRPYIAQSDVILLTSLWEGLPITIVESFAMHKPVVVTAVNGNKEIVRHNENGFLYTPGDIKEAAGYTEKLLDSKHLRTQFGEKGFENVVEEFSQRVMIEKTMKLYKNS